MDFEDGAVSPKVSFLAAVAFQTTTNAGIYTETGESNINDVEVRL